MTCEELAQEVVNAAQEVWNLPRADEGHVIHYVEGPYIAALARLEALAQEVLGERLPERR